MRIIPKNVYHQTTESDAKAMVAFQAACSAACKTWNRMVLRASKKNEQTNKKPSTITNNFKYRGTSITLNYLPIHVPI